MNAVSTPSAIEIGRRVRYHLPYGNLAEGLIVSVQGQPGGAHRDQVAGPMRVINPSACQFEVITFDGLHFHCRESSIGRPGIGRVDLLDRVHGLAMIERALELVSERRAREATEAAIARQQFADAVEQVKAENPHLLVAEKYAGAKHAAKNIRIELKRAGIKARSVRSSSFAGGDAIDITLAHDTSDEVLDQVGQIAEKYRAGRFNGMEDIYEYSRSPWTEVFGDAKYITVQRAWGES